MQHSIQQLIRTVEYAIFNSPDLVILLSKLESEMELIGIEVAAQRMQVPTAWAQGMVNAGQLKAIESENGVLVDGEEISARGWDAVSQPVAPSYGSLARMMTRVGLAQGVRRLTRENASPII